MKSKLNILFFLAVSSMTFSFANAQETEVKKENAPILQRVVENKYSYTEFFTLPYVNPSMKYKQYNHTLNEVFVGGEIRDESSPILMQQGDGERYGIVDAVAFISRDKYSMWGSASYNNGKQKNMRWNETSDFLLLYPYVMGDSIGGDSRVEKYYFNGGYAGKIGRVIWGLDASYKATLSYRQIDPRPRNITGELEFHIGAALSELGNNRLGAYVNAYKYKQKNVIEFYNEQGNLTLYHFTGLGTDYYRYRGEKKETYYKGNRFGAGLNLIPENGNGFTANVEFNRFKFEKIISSLNNLPMAELKDYTTKGEVGYKTKQGSNAWGTKAEILYEHKKGFENIFGDPANDIYPLIGSTQQYGFNQQEYMVSGFYEKATNDGFGFSVNPELGFYTSTVKYIYPKRELSNDRLNAGAKFNAWKQMRKFLLRANIGVKHSASMNADLILTNVPEDQSMEALNNNYKFIDSSNTQIEVGVKGYYQISRKIAGYISADWKHGWFVDNVYSNLALVTVGVAF